MTRPPWAGSFAPVGTWGPDTLHEWPGGKQAGSAATKNALERLPRPSDCEKRVRPMLTIPFAAYLIGLALVLQRVFRRAGEDGESCARLALKRGLVWTGIWGLLFLIYVLILGLGSFGM